MLLSLQIENFAIIEKVQLDFECGMTVLSGETGAGKSIIIDALGVLCGGRGSVDYIRQGAERLVIEGLFDVSEDAESFYQALSSFGITVEGEDTLIVIRREILQSGHNVIRVNGQLANVTLLKTIGKDLVDIHGQHEHQALLERNNHVELLDEYGGESVIALRHQYMEAFEHYQNVYQTLMQTMRKDHESEQRLSYLQFQLQEIESYQIEPGEDEELEQLSRKLQHQQEYESMHHEINYVLSESDHSILIQLAQVSELLESMPDYYEQQEEWMERLNSIHIDMQEFAHTIASRSTEYLEDQSIDEIESRLGQLSTLKRKYKMTIEELVHYYEQISEEVSQITHREQYLDRLTQEVQSAYQSALQLAEQLSQLRHQVAEHLSEAVERELDDLYMANSQFRVNINSVPIVKNQGTLFLPEVFRLNNFGMDQVEFYVSTNIGEGFNPLVDVASGGELSRLMLALKNIFSQQSVSKTMIFDEIDTGVSGEVTYAIADKIHEISRSHQVICVTHHPQVAAIAEHQIHIRKSVQDERTSTQTQVLTRENRIDEIAMMISGANITKTSLDMAQELFNKFHPN